MKLSLSKVESGNPRQRQGVALRSGEEGGGGGGRRHAVAAAEEKRLGRES